MALSFPEDGKRWIAPVALLGLAALLLYRAFSPPAEQAGSAGEVRPARESRSQTRARASISRRGRWTAPAPPPGEYDPALELDLLAKVQGITYQGSGRNIFQYHTPVAPIPEPAANAVTTSAAKRSGSAPPPPIPLKYYGYAHKPNETAKKAFFLDGEEIFIATEGETVNKRYKIIKIGVNTVEVEDLVNKNKQTLPLQET